MLNKRKLHPLWKLKEERSLTAANLEATIPILWKKFQMLFGQNVQYAA